MAIYVDFVGLNTLIQEPVDTSTNEIGNLTDSTIENVRNVSIKTINEADYLVALNTHRNGPYGYPSFKQIRNSDNAVVRRQKLDNTFSHYEYPGVQRIIFRGGQRYVITERRKSVKYYNEVPVVSKHRPLKMIASVTTTNQKTKIDQATEVEVFSTFGNRTQYFSNDEINEFFNATDIVDSNYENFIDLYLDGGLDGDASPVDQFKSLKYSQVVFPKEIYSYKNYMRSRVTFDSGYWRDIRSNRTQTDVSDNGYGFTVFSQSVWVLDGEQDFDKLNFELTPGTFTLNSTETLMSGATSASAASWNFLASDEAGNFFFTDAKYRPALAGPTYPISSSVVDGTTKIYTDPSMEASTTTYSKISEKVVDLFSNIAGFTVEATTTLKHLPGGNRYSGSTLYAPFYYLAHTMSNDWQADLSQSCLSFWLHDDYYTGYGEASSRMPSGTVYHEQNSSNQVVRKVAFTPENNGSLVVSLGTVFNGGSGWATYDADSPYSYNITFPNIWTTQNRWYRTDASTAPNALTNSGGQVYSNGSWGAYSADNKEFTRNRPTHFFIELNQSGSEDPKHNNTGELSGSVFRETIGAVEPVKLYINGVKATVSASVDLNYFLTGSATKAFLIGGNTSVKLGTQGGTASLDASNFRQITPTSSVGFSYSYWIKFASTLTATGSIFSIRQSGDLPVISHFMHQTGSDAVGYTTAIVTAFSQYEDDVTPIHYYNYVTHSLSTGTWYHINYNLVTGSGGQSGLMSGSYMINSNYTQMNGHLGFDDGVNLACWISGAAGVAPPKFMANSKWSDAAGATGASLSSSYSLEVLGTSSLPTNVGEIVPQSWSNVHLNELVVWNTNLSDVQRSASYGGGSSVTYAGADYTSDTSTPLSLESSNTVASEIKYSRLMPELNAIYDSTANVSTISKTTKHMIMPFGNEYYTSNFITDVISGGDSGEFDFSAWIKPTHVNPNSRAITINDGASSTTFKTNLFYEQFDDENLLITFWWKPTTSSSQVLLYQERGLKIYTTGTYLFFYAYSGTTSHYWRALWSDIAGGGLSTILNEWHFISIEWNGILGNGGEVVFGFDGMRRGHDTTDYSSRNHTRTNSTSDTYTKVYLGDTNASYSKESGICELSIVTGARIGAGARAMNTDYDRMTTFYNNGTSSSDRYDPLEINITNDFGEKWDGYGTGRTGQGIAWTNGSLGQNGPRNVYEPVLELDDGEYFQVGTIDEGEDSWVQGINSGANASYGFTCSFWIKNTESGLGDSGASFISLQAGDGYQNVMSAHRYSSTNNVRVIVYYRSISDYTTVLFTNLYSTIYDGDWHHVFFTMNAATGGSGEPSAGSMAFWVDGVRFDPGSPYSTGDTVDKDWSDLVGDGAIVMPTQFRINRGTEGGMTGDGNDLNIELRYIMTMGHNYADYLNESQIESVVIPFYRDAANSSLRDPFMVTTISDVTTGMLPRFWVGPFPGDTVPTLRNKGITRSMQSYTSGDSLPKETLLHHYKLGPETQTLETPLYDALRGGSYGILSGRSYNSIAPGFIQNTGSSLYYASGDLTMDADGTAEICVTGAVGPWMHQNYQDQLIWGIADKISNYGAGNDDGIGLFLTASSGGYRLKSRIACNGGTPMITLTEDDTAVGKLLSPNKWYHVHASYNLSTNPPSVIISVDGELRTLTTASAGSGTYLLGTSNTNANVNVPSVGLFNSGSNYPFCGFISDACFWDNNALLVRRKMHETAIDGVHGTNPTNYIDTSDTNLKKYVAAGYTQGGTLAQVGTTAGGVTQAGTLRWRQDSDPSYYCIDIPKKLSLANDQSTNVYSFWFKPTNPDLTQISPTPSDEVTGILRLGSDAITDGYNKEANGVERHWIDDDSVSSWAQITGNRTRAPVVEIYYSGTTERKLHFKRWLKYTRTDNGSTYWYKKNCSWDVPVASGSALTQYTIIHDNGDDGTDTTSLYLNGLLVSSVTDTDTPSILKNTEFNSIMIGGQYVYGYTNGDIGNYTTFSSGSILDELAIVKKYDSFQTSDWAEYANTIYNGGTKYDFTKENLITVTGSALVGYWKLGETDWSQDTTLSTTGKNLTDFSGNDRTMTTVYGGKFHIRKSALSNNSEIKAHYSFDDTLDSSPLAYGALFGAGPLIPTTAGTYTVDFANDGDNLSTEKWLLNHSPPVYASFFGDRVANASPTKQLRPNGISTAEHQARLKIPEICLFKGRPNDNDVISGSFTIAVNGMPAAGDQLFIVRNPSNTGPHGGSNEYIRKKLTINFVAAGAASTAINAGTGIGSINLEHNDASDTTEVTSLLKALLDHANGLNSTAGAGSRYYNSVINSNTTLQYSVSGSGLNGLMQIVGSCSSPNIDVSGSIGYSHISKALTGWPAFNYRAPDDTDLHRKTQLTSAIGGLYWNSAKPYIWHRGSSSFETNLGIGDFGALTGGVLPSMDSGINSGSSTSFIISTGPTLDLKWVTVSPNNHFNIGGISNFNTPGAPTALIGGAIGAQAKYGPGVLQNSYNAFTQDMTSGSSVKVDNYLTAAACYFRRHSLTASTSLVAPYGGFLAKLTASHDTSSNNTELTGNVNKVHLYLGSAKWEAGDFAGYFDLAGGFVSSSKAPFYNSYTDFAADARPTMKEYGLVPEYRSSDHIEKYLAIGPTEQKLDLFRVDGGLETAQDSSQPDFYKIYSTTDFLKHFELIQEDHSDFVDPFSITLRCKAVKKFLPYEGFYPAQRTAQIAEQFYSSYKDNINIAVSNSLGEHWSSSGKDYGIQYLLNPLFSPGILFNTIKSGVAVDYPLITDTGSIEKLTGTDQGGAVITAPFDTRIPFEALVEPEKHLANRRLASNEPDPNGDTKIMTEWGGQGNELYHLMISNFLAEVPEFFLESKSFTTIASLSQGDANFGNAQLGKTYMMRLKMFRPTVGTKNAVQNHLGKSFGIPQDTGSMTEAVTMYSRPSAFGPPHEFSASSHQPLAWSEFKFAGSTDFSYVTGSNYSGAVGQVSGGHGLGAIHGYNWPFTPPYYHGEAWADITYVPDVTGKKTLAEIINNSSVEFYRYYQSGSENTTVPHSASTITGPTDVTVLLNDQAMQLASSVNIFSKGVLEQDITANAASGIGSTTNVQVDTDISNKYRWIIQTKFETPILNFNHYTYGPSSGDYGITLPGVGPMQTPIGMWHQYGHLPQDSKEGVFLQVDDVPQGWIRNAMNKTQREAKRIESLASLCGFSTEPIRLGEVDGVNEISEAVVAIPFYEKNGRRQFFNIKRRDIENSLSPSKQNLVGETIIDMVNKMQKFVMPPPFDFIKNERIKPFSMYIFEFTHNLTKQDLADIWQNLPPRIHTSFEVDTVSISHHLLTYELLGKGGKYRRGRNSEKELLRNDRSNSINPEIQWLVFKVKQRAKTRYFEKIFARNESQQLLSQRLKLGVSADTLGRKRSISYNWPYDYFSLIEGIQLTTEIDFMEVDEEESAKQDKLVSKPKIKIPISVRKNLTMAAEAIEQGVSGDGPAATPPPIPDGIETTRRGKITRRRRVYRKLQPSSPPHNHKEDKNKKNKGKK